MQVNAGLLELWRIGDYLYQKFSRLEYVDKKSENIFRIVFCKYRGPKLITRDGVVISNGDPIVKLHIHNWMLTKNLKGIKSEAKLGLKTYRAVRNSLPDLALYIDEHPKGKNVKAIVGTTLLHRGVDRLGFDVENVPDHLKFRFKNFYLKIMLYFLHPNGRKRLKLRSEELRTKRVYISKQYLTNRYGYAQVLEEEV